MKLITVAGPPSSGKTSVILRLTEIAEIAPSNMGVVKFDCLTSKDEKIYAEAGIAAVTGISGKYCPDHFFVSNVEEAVKWGKDRGLDLLITESAGLCNRCSPYINGVLSVCVVDNLSGVYTPAKIGPMLKMADIIVVTKGDIVSQAEREVFAHNVKQANRRAKVIFINGITGQGVFMLKQFVSDILPLTTLANRMLRFTMPSASCSYCTGETRVGEEYQMGSMSKIDFSLMTDMSANRDFRSDSDCELSDYEPPGYDPCEGFLPQYGGSVFPGGEKKSFALEKIEIKGGRDKDGRTESAEVTLMPGDVISIVGPTGAGKSRLLEDVEYIAQGDTPTGRFIRLNGMNVEPGLREQLHGKLMAQLSQNMNFVMDISVYDFLKLHSESRKLENPLAAIEKCLECANDLAGESFSGSVRLTQLSGGQSRALMIADIAYLSESSVVLIDEIENAGIDRRKAVAILADRKKIVLLATHDPLLALSAPRRIVIKNGGISRILDTTAEEKQSLEFLTHIDNILCGVRECLRMGENVGVITGGKENI